MTRDELLRENETMHTRLGALLSRAGDDRLVAPGPNGSWSVKDHLAHLADWQGHVAKLLAGTGTLRDLKDDAEMDRLNEATVAASRARSLAEVRADIERSYQALRAQVERLSDAELNAPPPYGRDWNRRLWQHVAANGFDHYREHVEALEALLA